MRRLLAFFRTGNGLSSFAIVALAWMILVILEGAVVRATGSGAGCGNHWPLCNGDVLPRHPRLATIIEFTHRSMTGVCTLLVGALVAWTYLARPKGDRARIAATWSGVLLLTEGFLGAVLVKGGYVEHNASNARVVMQCVHFTNTLLLLGTLSLTWWWQDSRRQPTKQQPALRNMAFGALGFMVLTGATGSVAALADTLFPAASLRSAFLADLSASSPLLVRMRWIHPASSLIAVALISALAWKLPRKAGRLLLGLVAAQILLGVADVLTLAPVSLQVLHLFAADLLWVAVVVTAAEVGLASPVRGAKRATAGVAERALVAERV